MTLHHPPTVPEGYALVTTGRIRFGDIAYGGDTRTWGSVTPIDRECLGTEVSAYYAVARHVGKSPRLSRSRHPDNEPNQVRPSQVWATI